jgi:hypothetical protein
MGCLPSGNIRHFQAEDGEQTFRIRAFSHPLAGESMVIIVPVASQQGSRSSGFVTASIAKVTGWNTGLPIFVPMSGQMEVQFLFTVRTRHRLNLCQH